MPKILVLLLFLATSHAYAQELPKEVTPQEVTQQSDAVDLAASEPARDYLVSEDLLVSSVTASVSRNVEQRLLERQDLYWGIAGATGALIVGFLGFVGFGQIGGMRRQIEQGLQQAILLNEDFRTTIERNVGQHLRLEIQNQFDTVSRQVALSQLFYLSNKIRQSDGFSNDDKDLLLEGLMYLKDSPEIIARREFKESLKAILQSFESADLDADIDKIHETIGSQLLEGDFSVALPLMLNYSERVLGSENPSALERDRFLRYTTACKRSKRYEDALPYLMVASEIPTLREAGAPSYKTLKQDFSYLTDEQKRSFGRILFNRSVKATAATARGERFLEAFRTFYAKHGNEFAQWFPPTDEQ